jgi:CheY-like chemotaxis protein
MMRGRTILLVEDNPDDVELTLRALQKSPDSGEVEVVHDGEEALEYLIPEGTDTNQQLRALPELVLLDINLPKVDGLQVLKRLRSQERTRRVPVVMLTSSDEDRDVRSSYDLGANSFLRKPVNGAQFLEAARCLSRYWLVLNQPAPTRAV